MRINAFKMVAVGAFVAAMSLGNVAAHAEDVSSLPVVQSSVSVDDVSNFFGGAWSKTKSAASTVVDTAADGAKFVGKNAGEGLEKAGKGLQDISKTEPTKTEPVKVNKADQKKVKAQASKVKEVEKVAEPKVEKAEIQPITGADVVKAKDAVLDGITGFLGKLRSSDNTSENTMKPR